MMWTVLLCCVCIYEFKYLHNGWIKNTNKIWHHTLFYTNKNINKLYITYRYTERMYSSVYSKDHENYSPSPLALFTVFITYGYTNGICPSVYSRDHGNYVPSPLYYSWCSLHMGILIECVCWYIQQTMGSGNCYPSPWHCSICSLHTSIPT
jgi:hypothetical protein